MASLIKQMCLWAGVPCDLEVFNLFSAALRQEGLNRLEQYQQRQGLVPDARIKVPRAAGHHGGGQKQGRATESHVLHALKVISCSNSRYCPTWQDTQWTSVPASSPTSTCSRQEEQTGSIMGCQMAKLGQLKENYFNLGM